MNDGHSRRPAFAALAHPCAAGDGWRNEFRHCNSNSALWALCEICFLAPCPDVLRGDLFLWA
jgi:hypothetical protein